MTRLTITSRTKQLPGPVKGLVVSAVRQLWRWRSNLCPLLCSAMASSSSTGNVPNYGSTMSTDHLNYSSQIRLESGGGGGGGGWWIARHRKAIIIGLAVVVVVSLIVAVPLVLIGSDKESSDKESSDYEFLDFGQSDIPMGTYTSAAIATDAAPCGTVAMDILKKPNASTMDAAIAALICDGVVNPHSMGIGGGFFMAVYDENTGTAYSLNARETAPMNASEDMFHGDPLLATRGALAVAVPGELHGYYVAHQKFGKLSWKELFEPTIELLTDGVEVKPSLAKALQEQAELIKNDSLLKEVFVDRNTGEVYKEGDKYFNNKLKKTLQVIAEKGHEEFYNGTIAEQLVSDLQELGGIITLEDLQRYKSIWYEEADTVKVKLNKYTLYSPPPPGSGILLAYMANIMDSFNISDPSSTNSLEKELQMWHRFVEAMKWTYAQRTHIGDPFDEAIRENVTELVQRMLSEEFARETREMIEQFTDDQTCTNASHYGAEYSMPEDSGTAHISIKGSDGLSISATSTINLYFGSKVMSKSTGILLNNEMDDFSSPNLTNYFGLPPSPANFIIPGKRPLSSMAPAIFVDSESKRSVLITGASGGTRITSAIAYVALRNLWLKQDLKTTIDSSRLHHQLLPMTVAMEDQVPNIVTDFLQRRGHDTSSYGRCSVVSVSEDDDGVLHAMYDYRKAGQIDGL